MTPAGLLILTGVFALGCNDSSISPTPRSGPHILIGAGDIGDCSSPGPEETARLLDRFPGTVFTTGDNAYPHGTFSDFKSCYDPTWGRHLHRTYPTPGNHEYESAGAAPYFQYFGSRAGPPGHGYYSYEVGAWHVISLNSEVGMAEGTAQMAWLRADLAANPRGCILAYWHRPLFSSGRNGNFPEARAFWRVLYEADTEVVLAGHDHLYERFAPQDPDGRADPLRGIRQFVVGSGGTSLYSFQTVRANSEVRDSAWGVLALSLSNGNYSWEFVPVEGGTFRDAGTGQCH